MSTIKKLQGVRDGRSSGTESPPPPAVRRPARPSLLPAPLLQQQIPIGVDDFRQQPPAGNANEYHQLGVGDQRPFDQIIRDQSMPIQSNNAQGIFSRSGAGGGLPGFGPPTAIAPPPQHQPQQHMSAPHCVELSRLPAELLRPAAIEQFLRPAVPLTLSSVKVVFDQHGFPLHTLVRFDNPDDADRTLARDGEQGIRIRPCTLPDFDRAVDGTAKISPGLIPQPFLPLLPKSPSSSSTNFSGPPPLANFSGPPSLVGGGAAGNASKERYCLTFSNMAYRADDRDIARFLGNVIVPTKITRLYYEDAGKASDRWLVEFDNMSQAEQAAELRGEIRGRPVRVVRTPNDQADRMLAVPDRYGQKKIEEFNAKTGGSEPNERMGTSLIGRQQKAPPLLDPRQSLRSGEEPHAQDSDGRRHVPSRSAHQRSRSRSPRDRRSSSRSSYDAPLSHSSRRDQQSHERREDVIDHRQAPPVYRQEAPLPSPTGPSCCIKLTNLPMHAMERDVAGFLDCRLAYHGAVHMTKDGNAYVELATEMDTVRALRQHRAYLGANCVNVLPVSKEELNSVVRGAIQPPIMTASPAKGGQLSTMGNMNQRQQQPLMSSPESSKDVDPAVVASIGRPGTVIAVHGLPVTITLDDLVAFFERYQLLEDSVRMHFDDTGCPTGDCLLAMATPGDAGKAVQELNGRRLNGSLVTMYVVRSG
uniref:RRM domain-containing protein n=1 Tax=Plectus sambesii TaxID=2011161 RepID=A0A914VBY7_9BILA